MKMIDSKKFTKSLIHAFNGFLYLIKTQNNFRIHILITFVVVIIGILLKINNVEWLILLLVIGLVWVVEAINTAFERLFDLVDESFNPIVKVGKDVSAAAVLFSAILSIIIGLLIFVRPFLAWLQSIL